MDSRESIRGELVKRACPDEGLGTLARTRADDISLCGPVAFQTGPFGLVVLGREAAPSGSSAQKKPCQRFRPFRVARRLLRLSPGQIHLLFLGREAAPSGISAQQKPRQRLRTSRAARRLLRNKHGPCGSAFEPGVARLKVLARERATSGVLRVSGSALADPDTCETEMGRAGLEPATLGLKVPCSTN